MSDVSGAPAPNDTSTPAPPAPPEALGSPGEIAAMLGKRREAARNPEPATPPVAGAAQEEPAAVPEEEQPPGETEEVETAEEPAIDPPRSLTKAEKEAFASLPRELQEAWASRERDRETYYRKGHDEAAAKARAAEAATAEAQQARQRYEQALPGLLQQFQSQVAAEFSDIKSWEDVEAMQTQDPVRFLRWQVAQQKGQALQAEANKVQQRQFEEQTKRFEAWRNDQWKELVKVLPEYADDAKAPKLFGELRHELKETGFKDNELAALFEGRTLSFLDHRVQVLLREAVKYRAAQKALKAAKPKPVPPVQRPGTSTAKAEVSTAHIRDLTNRMKETGAPRDIAALLSARRKAAAS